MKVRFGFRISVIVLFLALYLTSLMVLNTFFNSKLEQINKTFKSINFQKKLSELSYETEADRRNAGELINRFNETSMSIGVIKRETKIYSALFLTFLMFVSIVIFVLIFSVISHPLKELQTATAKIRKGDFSVNLKETGFKEIRHLKQSFNSMSRELDNVQKKLLKAEKEMIWKEFSRILAHEIKNPLTPIQLSIQRLEDKFITDERKFYEIFPESVKIINQEINNLHNLAKSFSNFSKSTTPEYSEFNPKEVIEDIIRPYIHKYEIRLEGLQNCLIKFDQIHFYQIITNLLQNAIDVSLPDEPIAINIIKNENILIQIIDNGKGISEEDLPRIFEPYFSKKKKGLGLGLALVKKLVEINKSKIRVESELEKGTKFEIIIEEFKVT